MIFSLHWRWKVEYITKERVYLIYMFYNADFEETLWAIRVLILFIKGYFWVNYVLELQILW
jgi:hypothetical protein